SKHSPTLDLHTTYLRMTQRDQWPLKHCCDANIQKKRPSSVHQLPPYLPPRRLLENPEDSNCETHHKQITSNGFLPDKHFARGTRARIWHALNVIGKAAHSVNQRKAFFLLQNDITGAFDRVDRDQLTKHIKES
ncbi:MAG: hypothetical protein V2I33_18250, partial [Kangiellaceae bacterium]|nr:hypothetical protein [Kangiellaceae bacterium]